MISFFLFLLLSVLLTTFISNEPVPLNTIEIFSNLNVTEEKITGKNGGHFDGTIYQKYELNDDELDEIIRTIKDNSHWKKGALSNELKEELRHIHSFDKNNPMFDIDNGYFFFKDKHADAVPSQIYVYDKEIINKRYSYNYILAALDVENKVLYYFQLDT